MGPVSFPRSRTRALAAATLVGLAALTGAGSASGHGEDEHADPAAGTVTPPPMVETAKHSRTRAATDDGRFALVKGCYALKAAGSGKFVAKAGTGYAATAGDVGSAEAFRMQATTLGRYLLYGKARDFLAAGPDGQAAVATKPGPAADLEVGGPAPFTLTPASGARVKVGEETRFEFVEAQGCPTYPEVEVNATGGPGTGPTSYSETRGYVDAHMHMMAFEFLGGKAHCGRPWHPYGAPAALVDCPDHTAAGGVSPLETSLTTQVRHDPVGWPTFKDWPAPGSLTHEQSYYKWLERSWRAGQRVFVNLFVENEVLCNVYPFKQNTCDDMAAVQLQAQRLNELQDYIDAQEGGPGKGWFRIVSDPFEARRVINAGKLAVVPGIEVSRLFGCGVKMDVPQCTKADIDRHLAAVHRLGVRDMELVNKFDNGLGGVAGDSGSFGLFINNANRLETGSYWAMQTCDGGGPGDHDREQPTALPDGPATQQDALFGAVVSQTLPAGTVPAYPPGPHCNARGLTAQGEHLVRQMAAKGMLIDPDHLSVRARQELLSVTESLGYSGVVSSHSWSTPDSYPRIYRSGGFIAPYAGNSNTYVKQWQTIKPLRDGRFYFGFGYGADANGFGNQGKPRPDAAKNPVKYPFKSFDGKVTLGKQVSGVREYDINRDGVAHYGLYPDWIEDLRMQAGDAIVEDLARGAEAYLQTWERAAGVEPTTCRAARLRYTRGGVGTLRLGAPAEEVLRGAGQPSARKGRTWSYCVEGKGNGAKQVKAAFTPQGTVGLIASSARRHRVAGAGLGMRTSRIEGRTKRMGAGVLTTRAGGGRSYVFRVKRGRITAVGVATRAATKSPGTLRSYLKLAGVR